MNRLQWPQAQALIASVISLEPAERGAFLSEHCADTALRDEIASFLEFLDQPSTVWQASTTLRANDLADLPPGSLVGPYVILERLGRGGMGEVFLGNDPRLHRRVALKRLLAPAMEGSRGQILREARAAARINHPHVATIHDVIEDAGRAFIVMEYVEGESLATQLQRGQLAPTAVVAIGRQLASALVAAHAQGVVHRDLKPANIQVTPTGSVKILDFGIADAVASLTTTADTLSALKTGIGFRGFQPGTVGYMSPEQMLGRDVGPQSDIFSLGVVLYEMASGRRLYVGADPFAVLGAMLKRPAPVEQVNSQVPSALSNIIGTALEVDLERRFRSAAELAAALGALETSNAKGNVETVERLPQEFEGITTVPEFRGRLLLAKSQSDLRRLKYELEKYLSGRPHDVDGRVLSDDVNAALTASALIGARLSGQPGAPPRSASAQPSRLIRWQYSVGMVSLFVVFSLGFYLSRRSGSERPIALATNTPEPPAPLSPPPDISAVAPPDAVMPDAGRTAGQQARAETPGDAAAASRLRLQRPPVAAMVPPPQRPPVVSVVPGDAPTRVPEPAPPPTQPAAGPRDSVRPGPPRLITAAQDRVAIEAVLQQYRDAYQRLDASALNRIWPSMPASIASGLKGTLSYKLDIVAPQIDIQGDTASVICVVQIEVRTGAGSQRQTSTPRVFSLRRSGTNWIIVGVR